MRRHKISHSMTWDNRVAISHSARRVEMYHPTGASLRRLADLYARTPPGRRGEAAWLPGSWVRWPR